MRTALTVSSLFDGYRERLGLRWVAGEAGAGRALHAPENGAAPFDTWAGHLNLIHPHRIQVLGTAETAFLDDLHAESRAEHLRRIFDFAPACLIVSDGGAVDGDLARSADAAAVPVLSSPLPAYKVINHLQYWLTDALADHVSLHGVFMEVFGIGVLVTGRSGVGKSELALELISRGHRLIADDAPEFRRIAPDMLNGSCPAPLRGFLEVRGLGILDVRAMFGNGVVKPDENLCLIIHLKHMSGEELATIDRLQGDRERQTILDVEVPQVTLPVTPGCNLAVLVEGAVRNHILLLDGYNAAQAFSERQQRMILGGQS